MNKIQNFIVDSLLTITFISLIFLIGLTIYSSFEHKNSLEPKNKIYLSSPITVGKINGNDVNLYTITNPITGEIDYFYMMGTNYILERPNNK